MYQFLFSYIIRERQFEIEIQESFMNLQSIVNGFTVKLMVLQSIVNGSNLSAFVIAFSFSIENDIGSFSIEDFDIRYWVF
jgi:hypothetical protein